MSGIMHNNLSTLSSFPTEKSFITMMGRLTMTTKKCPAQPRRPLYSSATPHETRNLVAAFFRLGSIMMFPALIDSLPLMISLFRMNAQRRSGLGMRTPTATTFISST